MRILDRQRYWGYFKAYTICFIALVGLYVVFDAFSNIDEFAEVAGSTGQLLRNMGFYYLIRTSLFYDRLCGVIGMMAAIFAVTWLQRDNELLAMLAAGISSYRVIRPVLISSVLISTLAIANQELVIPRFARELQLPPDDDGKQPLMVHARTDVNEIVVHGQSGFRDCMTVVPFDATLPGSRFGTLTSIEAKQARYIPETAVRCPYRGGWLLRAAKISPDDAEPDGKLLIAVDEQDLKDFPPPKEVPGGVAGKALFLRTNITFDIATRSLQWYNFGRTPDLIRTLASPIGNTERTEIGVFLHTRMMRPFLSMTLLFLSLPIVMGSSSRGMFINMGMSLGTSAAFYTVLFFFQYLGNNRVLGITPQLAAWVPLLFFGSIASLRWDRIRT